MTVMLERGQGTPQEARPHVPDGTLWRETGWMDDAACVGEDPEIFFAGLSPVKRAEAKRVCARCPVRRECLEDVMAREQAPEGQTPDQNRKYRHGVAGGMTPGERWKLAYPGAEEPEGAEDEAA